MCVIRSGAAPAGGGPAWTPLEMSWAVSAAAVGSRHVCGGWFSLDDGRVSSSMGWNAESVWYVTAGALVARWPTAHGERSEPLPAGSFLRVPAGVAMRFSACGDARGLVLFGGVSLPDAVALRPDSPRNRDEAPWLTHVDALASDTDYEPPLDMRWGVTDRLGGARMLCAARTLDPPRGRIQHHYHDGVEAIIFFLDGRFRMFSGPDRTPVDVGPGDIAYIAPGTLHSYCSREESAFAEEVAFYGGVPNKEGARTVFVEAPWSAPAGSGV